MADTLKLGAEFSSFKDLQTAIRNYEDSVFTHMSRIDSRTVEKAAEKYSAKAKVLNPDIKYQFLTYACSLGGKKIPSKSTGIRARTTRKCDCPVILKVSASSDGQKLVVTQSDLDKHNHDLDEEKYKASQMAKESLLDEETEMEIFNLIQMHIDKRLARMLIRDKLVKETGKDIQVKDIRGIERRMSAKLRQEADQNGDTVDDIEDDDEEEDEDDLDEEQEDRLSETEANEDNDEKEEKENSENADKPAENSSPSVPKVTSGRPRRVIREPKRFLDGPVPTKKGRLSSHVSAEDDDSDSEREMASPVRSRKTPVKVKVEPHLKSSSKKVGPKTPARTNPSCPTAKVKTKEKVVNSEDKSSQDRILEMNEKMLSLQEKILSMEKDRMEKLDEVVTKLNTVLEKLESKT